MTCSHDPHHMVNHDFKHAIKLYMFETSNPKEISKEDVMIQAFKNEVALLFMGKPPCAYTILVFRCMRCAARDGVMMHLVKRKTFRSCIGCSESSLVFQNCGTLDFDVLIGIANKIDAAFGVHE